MADEHERSGALHPVNTARDHILRELIQFGTALREANVPVSSADLITAGETLAIVGVADRRRVHAATRAALVRGAEDVPAFEEEFPTFWYRLRAGLEELDAVAEAEAATAPEGDDAIPSGMPQPGGSIEADAGEDSGTLAVESIARHISARTHAGEDTCSGAAYSAEGRGTDTEADLGTEYELSNQIESLAAALGKLPGRSREHAGTEAIDVRRTVRQSARTGGMVLNPPMTRQARTELACCVLVDVSQSVLETIDRSFLLSMVAGLHQESRRCRTFFFDTAVEEVTDAFDGERDPEAAMERAAVEWGGGTQIGGALQTIRSKAPHAVDGSTVVLVISDGLDVGEPELLESGMAWLAQQSLAVVWLNPLAASTTYEPTCRGMVAALPYVDGMFAFATPDDLAEMTRQLSKRPGGPYGYQFDNRERTGHTHQ